MTADNSTLNSSELAPDAYAAFWQATETDAPHRIVSIVASLDAYAQFAAAIDELG
ncbi:MAG: hypothetical protein ACRCZF_10055 [Gemmataceae bacterium]